MLEKSLIWFTLFALITIVSLLVIPRKQFFKLLPFGIVAGFLLAMAILLFAVPWFGLWKFNYLLTTSVLGIPLFIALAWAPAVMIFSYYVPKFNEKNMLLFWILIFSTGTTLLVGLFANAGFIRFINWDLLATFLLAFAVHGILALFVLNYEVVPREEE